MKLKYNFVINTVVDKFVAVAIGADAEKFNGFIKMNDIGAEIFEILRDDVTVDEIVTLMLQKHPESTDEEARAVVIDFTNRLKDSGIID